MALAAAGCTDVSPVAPSSGPLLGKMPAGSATGRYLVGLSGGKLAASVLASAGGRVVDSLPRFRVLVVDGVTNPTALQRGAGVKYVEPDFEASVTPFVFHDLDPVASPMADSNPSAASWYASGVQWDVKAMHADDAWPLTAQRGAGAKICIVDSGIDDQHQELDGGKVLAHANFVTTPAAESGPGYKVDGDGHGSHVAGEAAGRGVVTAGIAPSASLLSARVFNNAGGSATEATIIKGMVWCADNGAHVVNMSLGGIRYLGNASFFTSPITYGRAVQYVIDHGAVLVVAAGNSNLQLPNPGAQQITVPAEVPGVVAVGATGPLSKAGNFLVGGVLAALPKPSPGWNPFDPAQVWQGPDGRAFYSNYGTGVDVFAPGGRGSPPLSNPYWIVNRVVQGSARDNIYGVCSGGSAQTGTINTGGMPAAGGSCTGKADRYIAYAGTSMASPHVAGLAALLYAEIGGAPTAAKRARVEGCLTSTTDNIGPASIFGGGRVNAAKAVAALKAGSC